MSQLKLSLFGPFRAAIDGQPLASFPTDKVRALLAFLALEPDKPHRREVLAGLLWPDWPEEDARRNLRQSLHRLKQTLDRGQPGAADHLLHATTTGIQLNAAGLHCDASEFRRLLAEVESHRHRHLSSCEPCMGRLLRAVDSYAGELLAGVSLPDAAPFEEWQTIQREAYHFQAVTALQALADAHEQRGEFAQAHARAVQLLALEPWQESTHRLAMRTLAATGQVSEALAHFDVCQRILAEELGVEPSSETKALYWQIASGEFEHTGQSGLSRAALHHFPAQFTRFVGRKTELAHILDALGDPDRRLVTLVGPGGIGKSRLAMEAAGLAAAMAADFADGIFFVPLADVSSPRLLAPALATSLGVSLQEHLPERQLLDVLRPKRGLLVLDNFEHLVSQNRTDDGAGLIGAILHAAPDVQFLITSQKPLDLRAEWRIALDGLEYPAPGQPALDSSAYSAVQLFVQAARQVQPAFDPTAEDEAAIVRICQLTHGLPLAIELAAAWVRLVGCAAIAGELSERLDLLATRLRDVPERHRSLRAAFDYAWRLLTPAEQAALVRISVFRGSFSLQAAVDVAETAVADLAGLLDRSLLGRTGQGRYRVHPLLRQFAADLLRESGLDQALADRHMAAFAAFSRRQAPLLRASPVQLQALGEMEEELENVLAAWQHAIAQRRADALAGMMDSLFTFWTIRSRFVEGELHFAQAAAAWGAEAGPSDLLAGLQARLAWFLFQRGQAEQSRTLLWECVGGQRGAQSADELFSLVYLGAVLRHGGDYEAARGVLAEGLQLARTLGDDYYASVALNALGQVALAQDRVDEARGQLQAALELKRRIGDRWGMTFSLSYLGRLAQAVGDHRQAGPLLRESLALSQEFGDRRGVAFALFNLGNSAQALGQAAEAGELYGQSLRIYQEIGCHADAQRVRDRQDAMAQNTPAG